MTGRTGGGGLVRKTEVNPREGRKDGSKIPHALRKKARRLAEKRAKKSRQRNNG